MADPIRLAAAEALRAAADRSPRVLVGFDGFLDSITSVVGTRRSMAPDDYEPMRTIETLAARIAAAGGGRSTNIELRERELRAGGNGPLLAGALSGQAARVTLIGALGADSAEPVHPAYEPLLERCEQTISIAPSARTDALEFDDGKIMFNWSANLDPIDWPFLVERVGLERLRALCAQSDVLATINWTNLGGLPSIWRGLRDEILTPMDRPPTVFVDLSDPAKRTDESVRAMLDDLRSLNDAAPLTLGLNFSEANRLSALRLGESVPRTREPAEMEHASASLREALGLSGVLIHTRGTVAGAEASGTASVRTRLVERPVLSTGAGDHFNGGYLGARARGLGLAHALACGCDTASTYVGTGRTPDLATLLEVLESEDGL
jgi:sugar/nucleoside kinase (ribokinase family)